MASGDDCEALAKQPLGPPLALLRGEFQNTGVGDMGPVKGWNLISLPEQVDGKDSFRLLLNEYHETLDFSAVGPLDACNRGQKVDQNIKGLQYNQTITQDATTDLRPFDGGSDSNKRLPPGVIHQEAGQWLHMPNASLNDGLDVARMGTIPHGDTIFAFGKSSVIDNFSEDNIPKVDGTAFLQSGGELGADYLAPFTTFDNKPFRGTVPEDVSSFPGFKPNDTTELLRGWVTNFKAAGGIIKKTTVLDVDTKTDPGKVVNIPFVIKEANAIDTRSTFWIHEVDIGDVKDAVVLQYVQVVDLDFIGVIWPHVSINTLVRQPPKE